MMIEPAAIVSSRGGLALLSPAVSLQIPIIGTEARMVITRSVGETIRIGEEVTVTVLAVDRKRRAVRFGIEAPLNVPVDRREVRKRKQPEPQK